MDPDEMKDVVAYVLEEMLNGNDAIVDEHPGLAEVLPTYQVMRHAFEDQTNEIAQQLVDGDWVITRVLSSGIHVGEFMGMPPSNERMNFETIMLHQIRDGSIVKQHSQGGPV